MSDRITKKNITGLFETFCKFTGNRQAASYNDVGGLRLDHNSVYGGWVIERIENVGGGVSRPFGDMRRKSRDFYDSLHFGIDVVRQFNHFTVLKRGTRVRIVSVNDPILHNQTGTIDGVDNSGDYTHYLVKLDSDGRNYTAERVAKITD